MKEPERILICRSDRAGDLVLTLPLFAACRRLFPSAFIAALVSPNTASLLDGNPDIDQVILDDAREDHRGPSGFMRLSKELDAGRFDTALLPFCNWRLLSLVTSAGVKQRVANGFRSYLPLINKPVWIHRSHPPIHETSYCLAFLQALGVKRPPVSQPRIHLAESEKEWAADYLRGKGLDPDGEAILGVQPGCSGAGRTMSPDRWLAMVEMAMQITGASKVLVTGSASEQLLAERLAAPLGDAAVIAAGELDIRRLAAVQSRLALFLAPGSGPLHTAAAVGTPVLAFFPSLLSLSAVKWRPLGGHTACLQPQGPLCPKCRYQKCNKYSCIDEISVDQARKALVELLERLS